MAQVLIVDDDVDVASLVFQVLAGAGHDVAVANDGDAGLAAAYSDVPDVMILDWMMPRKTGIEVCAALRADQRFAVTRIMMLTARSSPEDIALARSVGADDYFVKPFSPRVLRQRVATLLGTA